MGLVNYQVSERTGFDTRKYTVRFDDEETAEIVRVTRPDKMIYCVSCMAGCPVECPFCASGLRYGRKLTAKEMTTMLDMARETTDIPVLVSMMGSGEPLLNPIEVYLFMQASNADRYALSTSGLGIHNLPMFLNVPDLKLQVSVHTVNDKLRRRMVPRSPPLDTIVCQVLNFWSLERVEWNFVFWDRLNDLDNVAWEIADWARYYGIENIKVNAARGDLFPPSRRVPRILNELRGFGLKVEFYETDGEDIQAGCGQLA